MGRKEALLISAKTVRFLFTAEQENKNSSAAGVAVLACMVGRRYDVLVSRCMERALDQ